MRLLSLPLDSSDASADFAFDRVSCKTQLQVDAKASLASYPRPSAGHRVLTSALRTVDAREIRNLLRRAPNHLLAKTDLRKNAVPAAPPQDKTGRPSKAMNPSSQPYQPGELPPVPPAFPGDAAAAIRTTYPAANRRSKSAHK